MREVAEMGQVGGQFVEEEPKSLSKTSKNQRRKQKKAQNPNEPAKEISANDNKETPLPSNTKQGQRKGESKKLVQKFEGFTIEEPEETQTKALEENNEKKIKALNKKLRQVYSIF